jgi:hypothetical protein
MKCYFCDGRGGEADVILDDGTGPWERCGFCAGTGELTLWQWITLYYWYWKEKQEKKKRFKEYLARIKSGGTT